MKGIVRSYNSTKGFGFIGVPDGRDVFVHQSNILKDGFRKLYEGDEVEFEIEETEKGLNAIKVKSYKP